MKENQTFFWTMNRDALTRGWSCNDREIVEPARAQLFYVKWGLTRYWQAASYFTSQLWATDKEQETARLARVASQPANALHSLKPTWG